MHATHPLSRPLRLVPLLILLLLLLLASAAARSAAATSPVPVAKIGIPAAAIGAAGTVGTVGAPGHRAGGEAESGAVLVHGEA